MNAPRPRPTAWILAVAALGCAREPAETSAGDPPQERVRDAAHDLPVRAAEVRVGDGPVHYLEVNPRSDAPPDSPEAVAPAVLFLHGARFRARNWQELGTLQLAAERGWRAVAVDLPGHGDSPATSLSDAELLPALIEALGLERPVVVSPSMSGRYSLPALAARPELFGGFVPIAPVGAESFELAPGAPAVPTLVLWGARDHLMSPARAAALAERIPGAEAVLIEKADHACYLDRPERFHELLAGFLERVHAAR